MIPIKVQIGDRTISDDSECFVIAEVGQNHQGNLDICKELFDAAKFCGVDAVKIQKRNNRHLYTKKYFNSIYNSGNAFAKTYGSHRQTLEFTKRQYQQLIKYARKLGLVFFATAWDEKSADFLDDIGVSCFKIASADIHSTHLLKYVAKFKKPMIVSTGTANIEDIGRAYNAILKNNNKIILMHCTSVYPTPASMLNLKTIESLKKEFPKAIIGFSNHFNGISVDPVAYTLGARVIEKNFKLDRAMKGSDHSFSLEPIGMRKLVRDLRRVRQALGDGVKKFYEEEREGLHKMGKSIVAAKNLKAGHKITKGDLAFKSPHVGLLPYEAEKFYGSVLKINLKQDQALEFRHVQA